ncbi:MAG: aminopeptidase P family protein [Clostridiaceae bacterium]|jgi:Xaa-Pro aminopeptidase|nr:aminopeptidase P family protein [Clostridiaceae bacterium]
MHQRLKELIKILEKEELDGILLTGRSNTFYFTGFTGSTSVCIVSREKVYLIVDFRYTSQAKEQVFDGIETIQHEKGAMDVLSRLCSEYCIFGIGIEGNNMTYSEYLKIKEKLINVKELRNIQDSLDRIRMTKDDNELQIIKGAVDIADKAFSEILPFIKPGIRESEVALELEYRMRKLGASGPSFETIIASGPRSALPHGTAGNREIKAGDAIVMDFGAIYKGYSSDMTRTVFMGEPSGKLKEIYSIVLEAQFEALAASRPGITGKELDSVSRSIINRAGYEKCFGHGLGHGVGIEIHEKPGISPKGNEILEQGMVFTVEPGIYVEGLGGVRIEDMVFLTSDGPVIPTKSTKDIIIL